MNDGCAVPGCRGEVELIYVGHGVCDNHWNQLADDASRARPRMALGFDATTTPAVEEEPMSENETIAAEQAATEEAMPEKKTDAKAPKKSRPAKAPAKKATRAAKAAKQPKKTTEFAGPKPNRVFAIRVTDAELAAIHRASGPRNATRLIRAVAAAFAAEDEGAFRAVIKEARELRG